MGVYQDEIDNNIQPAIDKKTAELAKVNERLAFFEGLAFRCDCRPVSYSCLGIFK